MGSPIATGSMLTPRSPFTRVVFLTIFCLVLFMYTLRPSNGPRETFTEQVIHVQQNVSLAPTAQEPLEAALEAPLDCLMNNTHLSALQQKYDLMDNIEYAKRYIRFHRQDINRKSMTKIEHDLFPQGFDKIDIRNPPTTSTCLKALEVPVPRSPYPKSVDASDLLFGISTTFERLTDKTIGPMMEWAHWLTDGMGNSNGAGLILRLIDASPEQLQATREIMAQMGMNVKVYPSDSSLEMAARYLSLLPALYNDRPRIASSW